MSTLSGGPNIITDGLVLYLDAGNTYSYTSGSTVWNDLSRSQTSGSLINGPTFSSANNGSIVFDGSNDYVRTPIITTTTTFTYCCWVYPITSGVAYQTLFSQDQSYGIWYRGNNQKITYYYFGADQQSTQTLVENTWNHVVVINSGGNISFYINNILDASTYTGAPSLNLSWIGSDPSNEILKGKIAIVQIYNRALPAQEVLQNYNATKGRFGL
jgi:hypothetical protein